MKKYLFYIFCRFPRIAHRFWSWLPPNYRSDYLKRLLLKLVSKGDTCFEVGANLGQYTIFLSHLVGAQGRVVAFEPIESNLKTLRERKSKIAIYDNVQIEPLALSDEPGEIEMYLPGNAGSMASLQRHLNDHWRPFTEVAVIRTQADTLDRYTARHHVERIDLLKVDIEGAESLFLEGAWNTIKRFRPIIVMEIIPQLSATFQCDPRETFEALREAGYAHQYQLTAVGSGLRELEYPISQLNDNEFSDYIFSTQELASRHG